MLEELRLRVVTPKGAVIDQMATSVTATSEEGEFCVLPEHSPVLASLKPGRLVVEANGETIVYATDVGFFECGDDHVNVMTQHCVSKAALSDKMGDLAAELASLEKMSVELEADSPKQSAVQSMIAWVEAQLVIARG